MSEPRKPHRRPEFDEIVQGWGGDNAADLTARLQLLVEFWKRWIPLSSAELKVARAMVARLQQLGGTAPEGLPQ